MATITSSLLSSTPSSTLSSLSSPTPPIATAAASTPPAAATPLSDSAVNGVIQLLHQLLSAPYNLSPKDVASLLTTNTPNLSSLSLQTAAPLVAENSSAAADSAISAIASPFPLQTAAVPLHPAAAAVPLHPAAAAAPLSTLSYPINSHTSTCVVKEVKIVPDDPKSTECIKQLEQEIKLRRELKHPNIVQYYGCEIEHIKGANLLVNASGVAKLADFGLANHLRHEDINLSLKGTPHWMAPEVLMKKDVENREVAYGVDIWSVGCTVQAMFNMLKEAPPIPEALSTEGKDFLAQCFQRRPIDRPSAVKLLNHPFLRSSREIH
ncbi:hypothetical protein BUALT_Bualt07G0104800 [Buddleja alternifolia]|uniref:Protein kinase domain-containing protein n=1 Tax=Buddleja alternifolia TaxID=168488 RepID=A0AAV6XGE8_9LAMI|nr:hypothetical protein BUALT_Bualt07G0104800 [Buddleja alternifolia]